MKFRLLEAEILIYQGRRPEVIALLNSPGVTYPAAGDLAIKRNLLCGLAHATLGQEQQSDTELQEARRLSDASNSELNGEVLQTEAIIQINRNHLPEAADLARKSLQFARQRRDSYLEASDLLNLGLVDIQMRHYDEALSLLMELRILPDRFRHGRSLKRPWEILDSPISTWAILRRLFPIFSRRKRKRKK